ncbi:uncharacterized protein Smp_200710 [Schistosoma mansoni]|uniref:Smp_200710 n=1 Tax=Schistosoma mansoni TaxID=6183 RepID=G4V8S5_SCHMA|nr:uncharacterized protein Smp_200710 [Schistosoma mansoni]|eukprot:XP_018648047.1 uncharacterized protein Smp_200710 [Schistosoma mansoni]
MVIRISEIACNLCLTTFGCPHLCFVHYIWCHCQPGGGRVLFCGRRCSEFF